MSVEAPQPTPSQQPAPLAPRPTGIFALAVLLALNGVLGVVVIGLGTLESMSGADTVAPLTFLAGIALSLFLVVLAIGLLRRRRWAQSVAIAAVGIAVISAVAQLLLGIGGFDPISTFFYVAIAAYLTKPEVHAYFGTT